MAKDNLSWVDKHVDEVAAKYSFPGHQGRPGQEGGSLPREGGGGSGYMTDHRGQRIKLPDMIAGHKVETKLGSWMVPDGKGGQVKTDESEIVRVGPFEASTYKFGQLVGVNENYGLYREAKYRHTQRPDVTWNIVDKEGRTVKNTSLGKPTGFKTVPVPDLS